MPFLLHRSIAAARSSRVSRTAVVRVSLMLSFCVILDNTRKSTLGSQNPTVY